MNSSGNEDVALTSYGRHLRWGGVVELKFRPHYPFTYPSILRTIHPLFQTTHLFWSTIHLSLQPNIYSVIYHPNHHLTNSYAQIDPPSIYPVNYSTKSRSYTLLSIHVRRFHGVDYQSTWTCIYNMSVILMCVYLYIAVYSCSVTVILVYSLYIHCWFISARF